MQLQWYIPNSLPFPIKTDERKYLRVVLENDGDVHVDDDEETEDEVKDHESAGGHVAPAVSGRADLRVGRVTVLLVADCQPRLRPASRSANLERKTSSSRGHS